MNFKGRLVHLLQLGLMLLLVLTTSACGRDQPGEEPLEPGDDTIVEDAPTPAL